MLRIDLGALRQGPIDMAQTVPTDDPVFDKLEFQLGEPVRLSGRLMDAGIGRYYWHGDMKTRVKSVCRRCLAEVRVQIEQPLEILFTDDQAVDDPAAYVIRPDMAELDPGQAVREELILAVPDYVVCREECRGICPRCGADLNTGTCACEQKPVDSRWSSLEALRAQLTEKEED
jgi:uncharacterized protein